ncbi:MAG: tRNA (cytidine(34)-2'-O)-methyltransferase [Coriobacteriia bacterium]|nr:tRNA (cytidine(34)-2'-O)-methyltransferase [Coriobacteriia bacterium]
MINVVLVEPEIPQNAGNIARTCACTGARLHLIEPMGFRPTSRNLARAGCDYWDQVDIVRWSCAREFFDAHSQDELHLFTGQADVSYADVRYGAPAEGEQGKSLQDQGESPDVYLVFGRESRGLDQEIIDRFADRCVRIPMQEGARSLNLSNAVAIAVYEVLRQQGFVGLQ